MLSQAISIAIADANLLHIESYTDKTSIHLSGVLEKCAPNNGERP